MDRVGGDKDFSFKFKLGGAETEISNVKYSYNWPYDFFSLVEFANIEADVNIGPVDPDMTKPIEYIPEPTTERLIHESAGEGGVDEPVPDDSGLPN